MLQIDQEGRMNVTRNDAGCRSPLQKFADMMAEPLPAKNGATNDPAIVDRTKEKITPSVERKYSIGDEVDVRVDALWLQAEVQETRPDGRYLVRLLDGRQTFSGGDYIRPIAVEDDQSKTQKEKDKTMEDIVAVVTTQGILEQLKIYGIKADPLMPVNDDPMECGHAFRLIAAYCGRWPNESPLGFTREDMGTMVEVNVPEFGDKWVTGRLIGFDWKKTDKGTIFVHVVNVGDDDDAFFSGITVRTRTGIRRIMKESRSPMSLYSQLYGSNTEEEAKAFTSTLSTKEALGLLKFQMKHGLRHPDESGSTQTSQWEQIQYAADDLSISVQAFFATVDVPARSILEDLMRKKLAAYRTVREGR